MRVPTPAAALVLLLAACGGGSSGGAPAAAPAVPGKPPLVVNSAGDPAAPPEGTVTLRAALAAAAPGERITFDPSLDGAVIALSLVAEEHTILKGEVMGIAEEPSGPVSYLVGWFDRDYGRSALHAQKDVVLDASALPRGVTLAWTGGAADPARVLAVLGDLEMTNVTVTGGWSQAAALPVAEPGDQPWTLARGGGVAVWGEARLARCTLAGNTCVGDFDSSRDRGAFGGGIYADVVRLEDCVVAGNAVTGGGAGGGGVCAVGGAGAEGSVVSTLDRCSVSGNRIAGLFVYGAGVYTDGGGIGNSNTLRLANCTVARNLAEPSAGLPPFLLKMGYWRGGGIYMSNGSMELLSCTIAENGVKGYQRTDSLGRRNLAGGVAATVGNAHAVDSMDIGGCIIAGNTVTELGPGGTPGASYAHDVFTGGLFAYRSLGHNRIGVLDFSQILAPVDAWGWKSLCRRHYPKEGDGHGFAAADLLDLAGGVTVSGTVLSAGVLPGEPVPLAYRPAGAALDAVPPDPWTVVESRMQVRNSLGVRDDLLPILLGRIEDRWALPGFAAAFTAAFEARLAAVDTDPAAAGLQPYADPDGNPILTLADTGWYGPAETWPKMVYNHAWVEFWHLLDVDLAARGIPGMGPEILGDDAWNALFETGPLAENPDLYFQCEDVARTVVLPSVDRSGAPRPATAPRDAGAVEE